MLLATAATAAQGACGDGLQGARIVNGQQHQVAYAPDPGPLATGRHFALTVVVCPVGAGLLPDRVEADARMPEHGHGMNYTPQVRRLAPDRWHVEGFMLHMAGRWTFSFVLGVEPSRERLEDGVVVR